MDVDALLDALAVAARALAREDAKVLAILGAGVQGGSHLQTFPRVREFAEIRVASRDSEKAAALAARHPRARAVALDRGWRSTLRCAPWPPVR